MLLRFLSSALYRFGVFLLYVVLVLTLVAALVREYRGGHSLSVALGIAAFLGLALIDLRRHRRLTDLEKRYQADLDQLTKLLAEQGRSGKLLIRRDLELTRANDQLHSLDQLKSDFLSVVTHQLRTPLSAIKWTLSMFLGGDMGSLTNEQRTFLMKTYESNNRMIALLNDMLVADQIESGKLKSSQTSTMMPDLLENVLVEIKPLADHQGVIFEFKNRKESYPHIQVDPSNMRMIIQNVLENAVKYSKPGGHVTLELRDEEPGFITFTVADSGIGIPDRQKDHVFQRFFRASNAVKVETDGSGLGLFILKRLTEQYHGKVWFESKEGEGSVFYLKLPTVSAVSASREVVKSKEMSSMPLPIVAH